jgi:ornithine carbamoyltransferase
MDELGGHAISLNWMEMHLGRGETIADTGRVLSRYGDAIMARVDSHADLEELARYAEVPVINGLSDLSHPCQALADLLTMWEKRGGLQGLRVAYVGDGNNVCNSLLAGCAQVGVGISVACARGYEPDSGFVRFARERGAETGAQVWVGTDPVRAVRGADVVYTDTFVSMGQEAERESRIKAFIPRYQVTPELFKHARKDAIFMHCLPAHRGEEVLPEVIDGSRSVVWDQAENRVHAQKAILTSII